MNLQGHKNDASESRPVTLSSVCLDNAIECSRHAKPLFGF